MIHLFPVRLPEGYGGSIQIGSKLRVILLYGQGTNYSHHDQNNAKIAELQARQRSGTRPLLL
jgi:hypothetical protein